MVHEKIASFLSNAMAYSFTFLSIFKSGMTQIRAIKRYKKPEIHGLTHVKAIPGVQSTGDAFPLKSLPMVLAKTDSEPFDHMI